VGLLERIREVVRIPILAIGGVTADNVAEVIQAGAHGAAVIGAILDAPDAAGAASKLKGAMMKAWQGRTLAGKRL
jgi:thiamine-phosphate pyrophosphorylase